MERRAMMICSGLTERGSGAAPTMTNLAARRQAVDQGGDGFASGAVARISAAPRVLDRFGRSACVGVDVFMRASFSGQGLLVPATPDGDGPEAHPAGALNPEMPRPPMPWTATRSPGLAPEFRSGL